MIFDHMRSRPCGEQPDACRQQWSKGEHQGLSRHVIPRVVRFNDLEHNETHHQHSPNGKMFCTRLDLSHFMVLRVYGNRKRLKILHPRPLIRAYR